MFISNWEDDDEGIEKKDLSDPKEQFLTAAEEGKIFFCFQLKKLMLF